MISYPRLTDREDSMIDEEKEEECDCCEAEELEEKAKESRKKNASYSKGS
jgi:hypothetical protein